MIRNHAVLLVGAALLCTTNLAPETHAEWKCPYYNGAYYPTVTGCPNWEWDANGPQARAQAAREAAAERRAEAAAAAQARAQAQADQAAAQERAQAEQAALRAAKDATDRQKMAENSPNNLCKDPKMARQLMDDFNNLSKGRVTAVDIEHLTTNVLGIADISCHGVFVLTNGLRLEGNMDYRRNVAGDPIVAWVDGGAASLPPLPAAPTPVVAPTPAPAPAPALIPAAAPAPAPVPAATRAHQDDAPMRPVSTQPAPQGDAMFQKGLSDRTAWETWFNGLQGDEKTGAFYWAGQRSLSHPGSCEQMSSAFYKGCTEAKTRLIPSDVLRKSELSYKSGWNSYTAQ